MKELIYQLFVSQNGTHVLSIETMLLNYFSAFLISLLIFVSYKITHSGPVYSSRFNVTLIMLTLITTIIMSVIGNNIALSLGMVGALSIVRFRTAIKDPRDTAYIFWTIAVGICCGVSDYLIAGIGSVFVFFFLILFGFMKNDERIILIIQGTSLADTEINDKIKQYFDSKASLRVHNCTVGEPGTCEYIYEVNEKLIDIAEKKNGKLKEFIANTPGISLINQIRQDDEMSQ